MITWTIDPDHSEVSFKVRHLMIANVKGSFKKCSLNVKTDQEDFSPREIVFTADTASIDTGNEKRDEHLRSADFFDSANYPQLKFIGNQYEEGDEDNTYTLYGDLSIKGITKPITLDVVYNGLIKDPTGNIKAGFSVSGKINRKDWNLNWNAPLETGGVMVSDEVTISCEIELLKQGGTVGETAATQPGQQELKH